MRAYICMYTYIKVVSSGKCYWQAEHWGKKRNIRNTQLPRNDAFLWLSHYLDPSAKADSAIGHVTGISKIMALIQEKFSPSLSS